jgi:hypothetical protein
MSSGQHVNPVAVAPDQTMVALNAPSDVDCSPLSYPANAFAAESKRVFGPFLIVVPLSYVRGIACRARGVEKKWT